MSFRGNESTDGNFVAFVHFLAKYDVRLKNWMEKHPDNCSWISWEIQNEMIDIMANNIANQIKSCIGEAKFFSIQGDEVHDVSNKEFLSVVIRYVNFDGERTTEIDQNC